MRKRHVPIRTCVACRSTGDKRGLLRVVRNTDGQVAFDRTGKAPGRGAYICASESCIAAARKQKKLERSLTKRGDSMVDITPAVFDQLLLASQSSQSAAPMIKSLAAAG